MTPSVPTTAAALLRVTVESSTPMLATVSSGIRKQALAANTSSSAFGAETTCPENVRTLWKPQAATPATVPTAAERNTASAA